MRKKHVQPTWLHCKLKQIGSVNYEEICDISSVIGDGRYRNKYFVHLSAKHVDVRKTPDFEYQMNP